jgi:hydrogenase maturation protease
VTARVLVAGVGNLFLGDDGFGPEVVRSLLAGGPLPPGVRVIDYGIRGMHLAYDLLDGWDALILVDALPAASPRTGGSPSAPGGDIASAPDRDRLSASSGGRAGEVVVIEVGPADLAPGEFDAHGMQPVALLGSLTAMGGKLPPTFVVGCRVESVHEGIGLSPAVAAAVPDAIDTVLALLDRRPLSQPLAEPRRP